MRKRGPLTLLRDHRGRLTWSDFPRNLLLHDEKGKDLRYILHKWIEYFISTPE